MTVDIQIISLLAYFLYGFFLMFVYEFFLRRKPKLCYPYFLIFTCLFVFILYSLNGGRFHVYFVLTFILGIIISKKCVKYLKSAFKQLKSKILR